MEEKLLGQGLGTCSVGEGLLGSDREVITTPGEVIESVSMEGEMERSSPPDRVRFDELGPVRKLLELLQAQGVFTMGHIKRSMEAFVAQRDDVEAVQGMVKPSGSSVREMFRADMCESGVERLPIGDCDLEVEEARRQHIAACLECSEAAVLREDCYFSSMLRCISHGWKPRVTEDIIRPMYEALDNYKSIACFPVSVAKEFAKMVDHGVMDEVPEGTPGLWHPMGVVIKNSDRRKAVSSLG